MPYQAAWDLQKRLARQRAEGAIPDTLILLEHPHTYTIGRRGSRDHLLWEDAAERGIDVIDVDRGGDITYHGPGQLVAYPIMYLGQPDASGRLIQTDYVGYLRRLEEVIIRTLAAFGVAAHREEGYTGVWVPAGAHTAKVAAIGVRVTAQGVSMHGAALNINPQMHYFDGIVPCGITNRPVTSLEALLGERCPSLTTVQHAFTGTVTTVFDLQETP
jgi:lipoate-protein ligase B